MSPDELRLRSLGVHLDAPIPEPQRMSDNGWARLAAAMNDDSVVTAWRSQHAVDPILMTCYGCDQLRESRDTLAETCRRLHREMWEHERREWRRAVIGGCLGVVTGVVIAAILDWIWRF